MGNGHQALFILLQLAAGRIMYIGKAGPCVNIKSPQLSQQSYSRERYQTKTVMIAMISLHLNTVLGIYTVRQGLI